MDTDWDCIVIGAGAAGLSAALVLGRARRRTLVVDAGAPSNRVSHGIGGLLGQDGRPPAEFYAAGRAELERYPTVELRAGEVVGAERDGDSFMLGLADGGAERAARVLLATGMDYRLPELPGLAERWGGSVFHCPFCHGWEHRGAALGLLADGDVAVHLGTLLRAWSDDVTLLTDGPAELDAEQAARLEAAGVAIEERPLAAVEGQGRSVTAVRFADGGTRPLGGLLVPPDMRQRSGLADALGAAKDPERPIADAVAVDARYATGVDGLFAAGDVSGQMPSVANAIASGSNAGAMVVNDLMAAATAEAGRPAAR